jgi:hypothetical protein
VGERGHPTGTVRVASVGELSRAEREHAFNFLVPAAVGWPQIEMDAVLDLLTFRDLAEQQPDVAIRGEDHALLVAGLIGIVGVFRHSEHLCPPHGLSEGVA